MIPIKQKQKAELFQALHLSKNLFILPNAWNGGSAKVFSNQDFPAIGTTSAGMAYAMGQPDGESIHFSDLLHLTKEIVSRVSIPVSVDIERGYADTVEGVIKNVRSVIEAGAVGINIEDGYTSPSAHLEDLSLQLEKIRALQTLKEELDIPFVINARTCACWLGVSDHRSSLHIAIERANQFANAGADCVFVPGALNKENVQQLAREINAPLNIIANPVFNDINQMEEWGIRRVSIGSGAVRAVYAELMSIAEQLHQQSRMEKMFEHPFSYTAANNFFS